jgi:hypothetical protein
MTTINPATRPMPTPDEVQELLLFLAANHDVAQADGLREKAERFQTMLRTAKALAAKSTESQVPARTRLGYVIAPLRRNETGDMEPCPVHGPFDTKEAATKEAEQMGYPSPDRVFIRPLYAR